MRREHLKCVHALLRGLQKQTDGATGRSESVPSSQPILAYYTYLDPEDCAQQAGNKSDKSYPRQSPSGKVVPRLVRVRLSPGRAQHFVFSRKPVLLLVCCLVRPLNDEILHIAPAGLRKV